MKLFCFMGPSGSGKSTIQHSLSINFLTNYTTRKPREEEIDGYHIIHVSRREFHDLYTWGEIAAKTEYADNLYGAPSRSIREIKNGIPYHATATRDSIEQFRELLGKENVIAIYIKPPSIDKLIERMMTRGDSMESIDRRIANIYSENELDSELIADYVVINDNLSDALDEVNNIIDKELSDK